MPPHLNPIDVTWLGQIDYQAAWDLQSRLAAQIAAGTRPPTLLLLEHPHTYTIGRRGGQQHILWDLKQRTQAGVTVVEVDRGGDITYHGPGQLVGYPLLPLAAPGWQGERLPQADFVGYLRRLEEVLIQTLAAFDLQAERRDGLTGVWLPPETADTPPGKIASIGIKIDVRGISRHGFALNVQPDMHYWQGIVPCGLDGVRMISLAEVLSPVPPMLQVVEQTAAAFGRVFKVELNWREMLAEDLTP
ncbi:MAG TPA: lipoyl(octanoyl) transferase LipB [Bellilinea sp.]|nr:lipoyl(octanoyl) transferase LipB [Bellilinea sp.]